MGAPVQPSVGSIHVPASVAAGGNDSSDCSRATPCQSFAGAYGKTAAGGVISCADYGKFAEFNFTITHSLTIDCDTGANVVSESGSGQIDVSTAAGDVVTLRGINIDGTAAVGSNRIMFSGAGVLNLERVNVRNNRNSTGGIQFFPTGAAKLFIADSNIANNGSAGTAAGITIKPASGVPTAVSIERSRIENNFFGVIVDGSSGGIIRAVIRDSVVSGNVNNGITAASSGSGSAVFVLENTMVASNNFGLAVSGVNAGMLVDKSNIVLNNTGLFTSGGGALLSYKSNTLNGNTTDGAFTGAIGQQ